jgi:hypothetical protein
MRLLAFVKYIFAFALGMTWGGLGPAASTPKSIVKPGEYQRG